MENMDPPPPPPPTTPATSSSPPIGVPSDLQARNPVLASQRQLRKRILELVVKLRPDIVTNFHHRQDRKARARMQARAARKSRLGLGDAAPAAGLGLTCGYEGKDAEQLAPVPDLEAFDLYVCTLPAPDHWPRDGDCERAVLVFVAKVMCWGRLLRLDEREVEMGEQAGGKDWPVMLYEGMPKGTEKEAMGELLAVVQGKLGPEEEERRGSR